MFDGLDVLSLERSILLSADSMLTQIFKIDTMSNQGIRVIYESLILSIDYIL